MAAIADPENSCNLESFISELKRALPLYAQPVFLRFLPEVHKTSEPSLARVAGQPHLSFSQCGGRWGGSDALGS